MPTKRIACFGAIVVLLMLGGTPRPPEAQGDCQSLCYYTCPFWQRIITNGFPHNSILDPDFQCNTGLCGGCGQTDADGDSDLAATDRNADVAFIDILVAAVAERDMARLATFTADARVQLNHQRHALQVIHGCNADWIAASVQLPAELFDQVALGTRDPVRDRVVELPSR